jgi:hypothetical protein
MVNGLTLNSKCEDESEKTESPIKVTKKWVKQPGNARSN